MTTLDGIVDRVRLEIGDHSEWFQHRAVGNGEQFRFELPTSPIDPEGFVLFTDDDPDAVLVSPEDFILDSKTGLVLFSVPPDDGQKITTRARSFRFFTQHEMRVFTYEAFVRHTHNVHPPVTYETLRPVEEPLIAYLSAIEALWALAADASTDIDISTPEGVMIPRSQRFQHLMGLIQLMEERYQHLAQQLNVGLARIEMFELRRVSATTNRYVPVYIPKEIDDRTPPTRVFPPIDRRVL